MLMDKRGLIRVRISNLVAHERTNSEFKQIHMNSFVRTGHLKKPIVVHKIKHNDKYLILDGHHRAEALKELGYAYIIARRIDYFSPEFRVKSWRSATKEWDKNEIIARALSGKLMRPKSTRHVVVERGREIRFGNHIRLTPIINYPIAALREKGHKKV